MKKIYLILFGVCIISNINAQTTTTFVADSDNTIFSESGTVSNGAGQHLFAGATNNGTKRRALIHFNLSSIPSGSTVTSATLSLTANKLAASVAGVTLSKVTVNWGEGSSDATQNEGGGAPASTGDATWTNAISPSTAWTVPGGTFSATTLTTPNITSGANSISGGTLIADIQGFINNQAANFGWIIIGSNEAANASAIRFASRENPNTTSRPTLSVTYTAGSLPVTLKAFSGALGNNQALLTWQSETELNNSYYEIEHSRDGINFKSIGRVKGNSNSTTLHNYTFTQNNLSSGNNFYRLAQYDLDGSVRYSQIIILSLKTNLLLQLNPNPATSFVKIITSTTIQNAAYTLSSATGQIVKKGILNNQQIDVKQLRAGQYWLLINTEKGETLRSSFIKE